MSLKNNYRLSKIVAEIETSDYQFTFLIQENLSIFFHNLRTSENKM